MSFNFFCYRKLHFCFSDIISLVKLSTSILSTDLLPKKRSLFETLIARKSIFSNQSPPSVFKALQASGVEGVELLIPNNVTEEELILIGDLFIKSNMRINSIHQSMRILSKTPLWEIKRLFNLAKQFHASAIVLHLGSAKNQVQQTEYIENLHQFQKDYGIKIGFENDHRNLIFCREKSMWGGKESADTIKKIGFGITLDTTHLGIAEYDIVQFFNENKNDIINIHIGDYKKHLFSTNFRPVIYTHLPIGKGELPFENFFKTLRSHKYSGLLTMEINASLEEICQSARYIKEHIS